MQFTDIVSFTVLTFKSMHSDAATSLLTHAIAKVRIFTSLFSEGIPAHTMKN
jgi:hypothetical protein